MDFDIKPRPRPNSSPSNFDVMGPSRTVFTPATGDIIKPSTPTVDANIPTPTVSTSTPVEVKTPPEPAAPLDDELLDGAGIAAAPPDFTAPAKPKKSKKVPLSLGLALLIIALSGGGAYYYLVLREKETTTPVANTQTTTDSSAATQTAAPVTQEELDQLSTEMDSSVDEMNDAQDFEEASFSDSALGL